MRPITDFFDYQRKIVEFQCSHPETMIWADPGLGKTVVTLTSIAHLINSNWLRAVLVIAPLRVARLVWRQEALKWEHTKHLTFSMVMGTKDQRTRALLRPANVYLMNYDNLQWLGETLHTYFMAKEKPLPFDGIVFDEVNKCKNSTTHRVKSLRKVLPAIKWTTGLTGTPVSNGYGDLHGQYLVVDKGVRLGTSKTAFRTRFYRKVGPYKEVPFADAEDTIKRLISDITLEMSAADYNPLPDLIVNNIELELPEDLRAKYDKMERELFIKLDSGAEVEMFNQAALTNKALQFSNGAMYPVAGMPLWEPVHDLKLDALDEILDEAQGQPIWCSYAYRSDAARIMERFRALDPINLTECHSEAALTNAMRRWAAGDCRLMIAHPACLHPWTEVLTELRGWVRIVDVMRDDRVFDGTEFVSHDGCWYSGYKYVIDRFGITMTPHHKIMVTYQWTEARDVEDSESAREEALYEYQGNDEYLGRMFAMRCGVGDPPSECNEAQPPEAGTLSALHQGHVPQHDEHPHLEQLEGVEISSEGHARQELWWSWHRRLRGMGQQFRAVLRRYVSHLFRRSDHRAHRRERPVLKGQLHLGDGVRTTVEQTNEPPTRLSRGDPTSCRNMSALWGQQDDAPHEIGSRNVGRRGGGEREGVTLRQGAESQRKAHVYDLVNCGPRSCFVIRNADGEAFISHNSAGHGIDGLQKAGHIVVWFGLNWSLDLYEQFNARVRRQGQGVPVICHRIMVRDTLDQAQALALDMKAQTQSGLRDAVKQYRLTRGVR